MSDSVLSSGPREGRPDLFAVDATHEVRVYVVPGAEVDNRSTRSRLKASVATGETRVFVEWPLRWRILSNLERWGIEGVAVSTL